MGFVVQNGAAHVPRRALKHDSLGCRQTGHKLSVGGGGGLRANSNNNRKICQIINNNAFSPKILLLNPSIEGFFQKFNEKMGKFIILVRLNVKCRINLLDYQYNTGSFSFTKSAQTRNAENVLIIDIRSLPNATRPPGINDKQYLTHLNHDSLPLRKT